MKDNHFRTPSPIEGVPLGTRLGCLVTSWCRCGRGMASRARGVDGGGPRTAGRGGEFQASSNGTNTVSRRVSAGSLPGAGAVAVLSGKLDLVAGWPAFQRLVSHLAQRVGSRVTGHSHSQPHDSQPHSRTSTSHPATLRLIVSIITRGGISTSIIPKPGGISTTKGRSEAMG